MNQNTITTIKLFMIGAFSALGTWLGILAIPIYLLLAAMSIDYITGLRAAKYRGEEISSYRGLKGLEKKIFQMALVGVGVLINMLLSYLSDAVLVELLGININISANVVPIVIAVWLIINEFISILENMKDIGVNVPSWLLPFMKNIKSKVEETAPQNKEPED